MISQKRGTLPGYRDHQAQVPYWALEIVKENKFFKHAFIGPATEIPAKDVEVPCAETGCKMAK